MATDTVTEFETCTICGDVAPVGYHSLFPDADGVLHLVCPEDDLPEHTA